MSDSAVRMAAYAEYLKTYPGNRSGHQHGGGPSPDVRCVASDHCHIHHVDEPDTGDVYRVCGECCHVFVTEEDLQAANLNVRRQIWQDGVRQKIESGDPDHSGAPEPKPGAEIYHCPLCAHDF